MSDIEWKDFIKEIISKGKKVNLKKICKERGVGLNTLYRKVMILEETDAELYSSFVNLHPYKPRDTKGIDFEQLMRESILTGISQRDLGRKYGISYRTIQRNFKKVEENNEELYHIYQEYVNNGELDPDTLEKVETEYIPQKKMDEIQKLEEVRKDFLKKMQVINKSEDRQLYKHYQEQIARVELQIEEIEEDEI